MANDSIGGHQPTDDEIERHGHGIQESLAPAHTGNDINTANAELTGNEIRAVQLKMAGLAYHEIGRQLDVAPETARQYVARGLDKWGWHAVDEYRRLELARLDAVMARLWPDVLGRPARGEGDSGVPPDKDAVRLFLQISQRRARLLGLDAPEQVQVQPVEQAQEQGEEAVNSYEEWLRSIGEIIDAAPAPANDDGANTNGQ